MEEDLCRGGAGARHRGGAGPTPPPRCGGVAPWRSRSVEEEDMRYHHAMEEPHRGGGGPTPWRRRSPSPWHHATVEDLEGDEMSAHSEDKPSKSYSNSDS
jgi:hypothetical protein